MYDCKIAENLIELRTLKGVTQEDVAQSLSISNKTVSKWENGASTPDLPMLIALSKYYGVTTDTLLGLTENKDQSLLKRVSSLLKGLDRKELLLKTFETVKSIIPVLYSTISKYNDDKNNNENAYPTEISNFYRSSISMNNFFDFVASSENVNIAVMMLRNKANFSWLNDPEKQEEIIKLFRFLSSEDTLSVLYFIHSTTCSLNFTEDYIARNTGINEERVREILDEFCSVGECHWVTAHLAEGEVKVYECFGDGIILSLISLAFEKMCGKQFYEFNYTDSCKMIGGK